VELPSRGRHGGSDRFPDPDARGETWCALLIPPLQVRPIRKRSVRTGSGWRSTEAFLNKSLVSDYFARPLISLGPSEGPCRTACSGVNFRVMAIRAWRCEGTVARSSVGAIARVECLIGSGTVGWVQRLLGKKRCGLRVLMEPERVSFSRFSAWNYQRPGPPFKYSFARSGWTGFQKILAQNRDVIRTFWE